jgi:hypothetical protein
MRTSKQGRRVGVWCTVVFGSALTAGEARAETMLDEVVRRMVCKAQKTSPSTMQCNYSLGDDFEATLAAPGTSEAAFVAGNRTSPPSDGDAFARFLPYSRCMILKWGVRHIQRASEATKMAVFWEAVWISPRTGAPFDSRAACDEDAELKPGRQRR